MLDAIIDHPRFPGATDPSALALLGMLVRILQPRRVLQLGTHIGFSSMIIADVLTHNSQPGHLFTVEPDASAHALARAFAAQAGLAATLTFLDGASTDPWITQALQAAGPFDLIYLDASHAYAATLAELSLIGEQGGWLAEAGLLVLHDAAREAVRWDPTGQGGVRRALDEWIAPRAAAYQFFIFEPPLWPNACGLGLLARRHTPSAVPAATPWSHVQELEQAISIKNAHIQHLEDLLRRIEAGRVLRLLRWLRWLSPAHKKTTH